MSNRTCMVASDEEDEDGNLTETQPQAKKSGGEILPVGEVVYLPNDTSSFQPEEEEAPNNPIPVVYVNPSSDNEEDGDLKTSSGKRVIKACDENENKKGRFDETDKDTQNTAKNTVVENKPSQNEKKSPAKILNGETKNLPATSDKNENKSKNATSSSSAKAADLMPPVAKRNVVDNSCSRKAKYARQATPICDAIMKEYSKRQKLMKMQGSRGIPDLSDMPIQDLLKQAKDGKDKSKSPVKTSNTTTDSGEQQSLTVSKDKAMSKDSAEKQKDPLRVVIKEELDIKPTFVACESTQDVKPIISESMKSARDDKETSNPLTTRPRRAVRGRRRSDDDPDFVPGYKVTPSKPKSSVNAQASFAILSKKTKQDELPVVIKQEVDDTVKQHADDDEEISLIKQNSPIHEKDSHEQSAQKQNDSLHAVIKEEVVDTNPLDTSYGTHFVNMNPKVTLIDVGHLALETNKRRVGRPRKVKESDSPVVIPKKITRSTASSLNTSVSVDLQENTYSLRTRQRSVQKQQTSNVDKSQSSLSNGSFVSSAFNSANQDDQQQSESRSNTPNQPGALSVANRLKLIAERIADVLSKDSTPNIDSEAKTLLETTQELLQLQKETLQKGSESQYPTLKIKQELPDESEDTSFPVQSTSNESTTFSGILKQSYFPESHTAIQMPDSFRVHEGNKHLGINNVQSNENKEADFSETDIFNQLTSYERALQKKLGITQSHAGDTSPDLFLKNIVQGSTQRVQKQDGGVPETGVSAQVKCVFVMDYFLSYQAVFNVDVFGNIIPYLAETILFCMNDLTECWEKTKNMQNFNTEEARQQQMAIAQQSCVKMINTNGKKFLNTFSLMINKITKTKSKKPLLVTFIYYLTGSLFLKAPRYRKQLHSVRKILSVMLKTYKYDNPFVWMVLQAPNSAFEVELSLIIKILKYFKSQNFVLLPNDNILNLHDTNDQESFQTLELSQFTVPKSSLTQLHGMNKNNPKLSAIAIKFVESLQTESHSDVKKIEQKLDHILSVLSGKCEIEHDNNTPPSGRQTRRTSRAENINSGGPLQVNYPNNTSNNLSTSEAPVDASCNNKGTMLAHLFETGLDSLFQSYIKSTKENQVKIKSEPVDVPPDETYTHDMAMQNSAGLNTKSGANEMLSFVNVKQEEERSEANMVNAGDPVSRLMTSEVLSDESHLLPDEGEPLPFASVSILGEPSTSNDNSQSGDSDVFTIPLVFCGLDEFTEEPVVYPKFEKHELDYDPLFL